MADIAGLAASAAGGGLFGLVGTVIGRIAGVVEARQLQAHERARWTHESTMQKLRIEADAAGRAADLREAETSGAWAGLSGSRTGLGTPPTRARQEPRGWVVSFLGRCWAGAVHARGQDK